MDRNIDLHQFYEFLARLNYCKDLRQDNLVPNSIQQDQKKHFIQNQLTQFEPVPIRFSSIKNYISLWKKLFYEEAKAQIIRSKYQEVSNSQEIQFINFTINGKFKLLNFKKVNASKIIYMPSQLVVISPKKPIKQVKNTQYPHLIGITQVNQNIQVRVILQESLFSKQDFQIINSSKKWFIQSITAINTLERIFKALNNIDKIDSGLKQLLLRPDLHNLQIQKKFYIPNLLDQELIKTFNESQYKAIHQTLKKQGITLIQGPPGTGKTKTVLGTLSVLLNSQIREQDQNDQSLILSWKKSQQKIKQQKNSNPWLTGNFIDWRDQPYLDNLHSHLNLTKTYLKSEHTDRKICLKNQFDQVELPGKVLVCGPSNAAVDQIIRKLISQKLFDKQGKKYLPRFVRVGQNYDSSLAEYSLQELATKQCNKKTQSDLSSQKIKILKDYRLIFSTLSSIGHQIVSAANVDFDTVIIDQAGQSIQIQNLIPLMYKCKRLILIGDPNQLPATIFSNKSLEFKYDQSLFQRLMKCDYPVNILKVQYRMHPEISHVIGKYFYGNQLTNGENQMELESSSDFPSAFLIFHLQHTYQENAKHSYRNPNEAKFIHKLTQYIEKNSKDIGIVSPYSQQVNLIQGTLNTKTFEVKTIDSFQGRQKNVIILSTVRSRFFSKKMLQNRKRTIGFVSDMRRINVSLSRAKSTCIIVGDLKRLCLNKIWKQIIHQAMQKDQVYQIKDIDKDTIGNVFKNKKKYLLKKLN